MPNSKQHREKAEHNRQFLTSIPIAQFADWSVVVAFYVAVHLAERLRTLLSDVKQQHSRDHADRGQFVQLHHRAIHRAYFHLYNAAIIARYQTVNSFATQFTSSDVRDILIGKHLKAIEEYVQSHFASLAQGN
jgi:hypothetical protein